jgi:lipopolysaccharide/colanic/teichoic acid biosynthesis glycosyltransferase
MPATIDKTFAFLGLLILSPLLLIITVLIKLDSRGKIFYLQPRVGKNNQEFQLYKFRTMFTDADKKGLLTVGGRDPRITRAGYYLRKTKLDELPQLINILKGEMRLVGPRPEVRKYVNLYTIRQLKVLEAEPGITDPASIEFRNENELLEKASDPERFYIENVMPKKLDLNIQYLERKSSWNDVKVIFQTLAAILR